MNAYIAQVPDNSTILLQRNATYRIDGTISIPNRDHVVFDCNGSTIDQTHATGSRTRMAIDVSGGAYITIQNCRVVGSDVSGAYSSSLEAQHGFSIDGTSHALITGNSATGVWGDFVYVGPSRGPLTWASDVEVAHNALSTSGRQGVSVTAGRNVNIHDNSITNVARSVLDVEPTLVNWGAADVTFDHNNVGPHGHYFLASLGADVHVDRIHVTNNTADGDPLNARVSSGSTVRRTDYEFIGNTSNVTLDGPGPLLAFAGIDGVVVTSNTQAFTPAQNPTAVSTTYCSTNVTVSGNNFSGAATAWANSC
jgi:hypothetical protein